jgi:hypothetical protein
VALILFTVGPIPAKLDAVKYITNRFKGGLALKTAEQLNVLGNKVVIVKWKHTELNTNLETINIDDVLDYYKKVSDFDADAYVLAAAVANLMPVDPFEGKFPSHKYNVGDQFDIKFCIAPRVIDALKSLHSKSCLIGYKLFDGTTEELIDAAKKTLHESKANLVFANHPSWAKDKKIALTTDGSVFEVSFDEHVSLIDKLVKEKWFSTQACDKLQYCMTAEDLWLTNNYPLVGVYGTFAIRKGDGFVTTTRGKYGGIKSLSYVEHVNFDSRVVYSDVKATLNASLLGKIFYLNPQLNYLVHGHRLIGKQITSAYQFPGTQGDLINAEAFTNKENVIISLPHHGYLTGFREFKSCRRFIENERELE